jgi:hypothetical protein
MFPYTKTARFPGCFFYVFLANSCDTIMPALSLVIPAKAGMTKKWEWQKIDSDNRS